MIRSARAEDIPTMVSLLNRSFSEDPHIHWFVGNPRNAEVARRRRSALMNYLCQSAVSCDLAWTSDDGKAVALWQTPDRKPRGWAFLRANLSYLFVCGLRATVRSLKMEENVRKMLPKGPCLFLWTVGIDESARGRGLFRELIAPMLEDAAASLTPVFLETTRERNVSIYEHYGFSTVSIYTMGDSPKIWFMRKG